MSANTKSNGELANALTRVRLLEARIQNLERALRAVIEIAEDALQGWVFYDER